MYEQLAPHYDALMSHIPYPRWAAYLCGFLPPGDAPVLDLGCGTGRFTADLCARGLDVIGVDSSPGMLSVCAARALPAQFLCQPMQELDLYGTIRGAFCVLDGINHLPSPAALLQTLRRVRLFLEPGGVFCFDLLTAAAFRARHGKTLVTHADGVFCTWQPRFRPPFCLSDVTCFVRGADDRYDRLEDNHRERAFPLSTVRTLTEQAGFTSFAAYTMWTTSPAKRRDERVLVRLTAEN